MDDSNDSIYRPTPRVVSSHALGTSFAPGTTVFPVRARDDLDPCDPPLEYADGRISWSGSKTREERDAARVVQCETEERAKLARRARDAKHARQVREHRIETLRTAVRACPGHVAVARLRVRAFIGPMSVVEPGGYNQAAHGNIQCTEICACGAVRDLNVNGLHVEAAPWGTDLDLHDEMKMLVGR